MKLSDLIVCMGDLKNLWKVSSIRNIPSKVFDIATDNLQKFEAPPTINDNSVEVLELTWEAHADSLIYSLQFKIADTDNIKMIYETNISETRNINSVEEMITIANEFAEEFLGYDKESKFRINVHDNLFVGLSMNGFVVTDKDHALLMSLDESIIVGKLVEKPIISLQETTLLPNVIMKFHDVNML